MAFDACVATMGGAQPSGLVRDGAIGVTKGKVAWIGRAADVPAGGAGKAWNIGGKVLTPDTHIVRRGGAGRFRRATAREETDAGADG